MLLFDLVIFDGLHVFLCCNVVILAKMYPLSYLLCMF